MLLFFLLEIQRKLKNMFKFVFILHKSLSSSFSLTVFIFLNLV